MWWVQIINSPSAIVLGRLDPLGYVCTVLNSEFLSTPFASSSGFRILPVFDSDFIFLDHRPKSGFGSKERTGGR